MEMGVDMGMGPGQPGTVDRGRLGLGPVIAAAVLMSLFDD